MSLLISLLLHLVNWFLKFRFYNFKVTFREKSAGYFSHLQDIITQNFCYPCPHLHCSETVSVSVYVVGLSSSNSMSNFTGENYQCFVSGMSIGCTEMNL